MLKWKSKLVLAAIETKYGADVSPGGGAAVQVSDVQLTPMDGTDIVRNLEKPYLGGDATAPGELHAKLAFKVELSGSGTAGTAPNWGVLLRGCGIAQTVTISTKVVYNPVSSSHESLSLHVWIDETRYILLGARGSVKFALTAQAIPQMEFEFTGLFTVPTQASQVTPNYTGYQTPLVSNSTNTPVFTVKGAAFVMRDFMLDIANAVESRFLIGSEGVLITDRADTLETTVEAKVLTAFDPFTLARDETQMPVALKHGVEAGHCLTFNIPKAQIQRLSGLQSTQNIKEWPLKFALLPRAGDDQWTLTLT